MSDAAYIIGIDLGTTNSAVSYADLSGGQEKKPDIRIFDIPQMTGPGEFNSLSVLPSFLYIPGEYDISRDAVSIPWENEMGCFAGAFARDHGAKVPARLVSSAKSWLCHEKVDRQAKILPWGAGGDVSKVSPVAATGAYLNHIKKAWNFTKGEDEDRFLENQMVILTVPASFNEVARDLTLEAAAIAGLKKVTLLEEPLAAFYSWLIRHEANWDEYVRPDELILICDVGGGTTDFTLISLKEVDGIPRFERIAVGDHLILGGDNIDLVLAALVESASSRGKMSLNKDKWKILCHQCRQAKENILNKKTGSEKITIMGEGSKLISGTLSMTLNQKQLEDIVMDGFFPLVDPTAAREKMSHSGITEFGLPYEQDSAITRHLGWFLEDHREDVQKILNKKPLPDLILFNGGSLKSDVIQSRICHAVRRWFREEDETIPRVLENPEPDLAVALGAAYYGLVKTGKGVKVGSGSPRGYYLGFSRKSDHRVDEGPRQAVCLVERGLSEGSHIALQGKTFDVLTNQLVSFDIYSSSFRSGDALGDVIRVDKTLTTLPPIQTVVQFGKKGMKTNIPVKIEAEYTETGTLSLWCSSLVSDHRWKLQFQLRKKEQFSEVTDNEVFEASVVEKAVHETRSAFLNRDDTRSLVSLSRTISALVECPKASWPLSFIRHLADALLKQEASRHFSPEHESRWLNLTGFTMRPGFGDGFDDQRIKSLWKIYTTGAIHKKNAQVASEWWIMWRRVAGGLTPGQQRQFLQDLTPLMMPRKGTKARIPPQQLIEMWMAVANMEKLQVKDKVSLGRHLLLELKPKKIKPQFFWSLSRIGARELLYGSADRVLPPEEAASWIKTILATQWKNPKPAGAALIQMARKTGDRARDLEPEVVDAVIDWLSGHDSFQPQLRGLKEVVSIDRQEEGVIFGEELPKGLVLQGAEA